MDYSSIHTHTGR